MGEKYILKDKKAVPVAGLMEWLKWFEMADLHVAKTEINGVKLSTVFLGIDHSFGLGEPLLFETMIFGGEHNKYQERYATWEQAEAGHARAVKLVSAAFIPGQKD